MTHTILTPRLIQAAATDKGNESMRKAGRTKWNEDDWNAAAAEYQRLSEGATQ